MKNDILTFNAVCVSVRTDETFTTTFNTFLSLLITHQYIFSSNSKNVDVNIGPKITLIFLK